MAHQPNLNVTLSLFPPFTRAEDLSDTLYKLAFQMQAYPNFIGRIQLWRDASLRTQPLAALLKLPDYLDPACRDALAKFFHLVVEPQQLMEQDGLVLHPTDESHVLIWNAKDGLKAAPFIPVLKLMYEAGKAIVIDSTANPNDLGVLQYLFYRLDPDKAQQQQASWQRLILAMARCSERSGKAYIFAPGPSLQHGLDSFAYDDGIRIVCNSIISSPAISNRIKPDFICLADDFLHAGAIAYAGEFRKHLHQVMLDTEAYLVCRATHQRYFEQVVPREARARVIGLPGDANLPQINLNIAKHFMIKDFGNILTMFMLPLAATLSNKIFTVGCDGRAPNEQNQYWSYPDLFPIERLRWSLAAGHPAQKNVSGAVYVSHHEQNVRAVCEAAEGAGKTIASLTPSFIPALAARHQN